MKLEANVTQAYSIPPATLSSVFAFPLEDDLVLVDDQTGEVFVLNRTGAQIWALLDGSRTSQSIAREISDAYRINGEEARKDVEALIGELSSAGLLQSE